MLFALLAAALAAGTGDPVVARADGEAITAAQVTARAEELGLPALAALETTIRETLLAHAASAEGLARDPEVRARLEAERRALAVQQLLEVAVYPSIRATESEIEALYHLRADQVRLSMAARSTRAEAEAVLTRLRAGGALLEEARGSPDPVLQAKSGVLGWVARGELAPALAQAAFSAPFDTPTGPVPVPKGFAIIVVHDRELGSDSKMASQASELRQKVELSKREPAIEQFLAKLRKRRHARIDSAFLERTGDRLDATTEDLERAVATAGTLTVRYADVTGPLRDVGDGTASARASTETKQQLSRTLLDRKLLEEAAVSRGAHSTPQLVRALRRFERRLLAVAYVRKLADAAPGPTDAEVEARYRLLQLDPPRPLAEVRANVTEQLRREREQAVVAARLARLRAEARVVVDEAVLA
ncbi:MAG TPA: peptidylprolyl isomerase, partial [Anaeromyxobacteraceae bacterium]